MIAPSLPGSNGLYPSAARQARVTAEVQTGRQTEPVASPAPSSAVAVATSSATSDFREEAARAYERVIAVGQWTHPVRRALAAYANNEVQMQPPIAGLDVRI